MHGTSPLSTEVPEAALRDQLSSLLSLLVLSIRMTESRAEQQILELATTSGPSLVECRMHGAFLQSSGWLLTSGPLAADEVRADLEAQFAALNEAGGPVSIRDDRWSWAFPLRSLAGLLGHLIVGADEEPSSLDQFLLRVLAQQVGIAIANARLHDRERATSAELRAANARLAESVESIRRRGEIHERLTRAAMTGTGLAGIADAVHDLTGHPIVVEDRAGNVIAHAGTEGAEGQARQPRAARERMIQRALEAGGPVRELGRVVVIASPHDGVAGVMALIDPDGTAGESEIVALEHGATVAGMELARLRSLGETQLRLSRDLLEDLLAGIDPEIAVERARAIGCDLLQPRRVAVVEDVGSTADEDRLFGAVRRALRDQVVGSLLTTRAGAVVVLADGQSDWEAFRAAVVQGLDGGCRIGVGGSCAGPGDVPRSHREARLALKMGDASAGVTGITLFDDLGVFRLFAEVEDTETVERFVRTWLGPLLDYDARKPAELVPTLTCFLELGQAYDATSDALAIHRSTLKYRLQRIREISQQDLSDPDTRFNFQLATRAWQTLVALRGTEVDGHSGERVS
jgi:GGDEF-like domain/PucR C-terminal helix-turn-helix domain